MQLQPDSQRGLWLLGISDFQHGQYAEAAATWRLLQPQLEPGSKVAKAVAEQIAAAEHAPAARPPAAGTTAPPPRHRPSRALQVQVSAWRPACKTKLRTGDTLFVYARAANGPPMPLAVARLDAGQLAGHGDPRPMPWR